jgi:hypothetical protein
VYQNEALPYGGLEARPPIPDVTAQDLKGFDWKMNETAVNQQLKAATPRSTELGESQRGYSGWLLLNPQFVSEHDGLLIRHRQAFLEHGFPQPAIFGTPPGPRVPDEVWIDEYKQFCDRWDLLSLTGPDLPNILPTVDQLPWSTPGLGSARGMSTSLSPSVMPIRGRTPMAESLAAAARGSAVPEHLTEWCDLIRPENLGTHRIPRFVRLFRLQHYWRQLHLRYPSHLRRSKMKLVAAFARTGPSRHPRFRAARISRRSVR